MVSLTQARFLLVGLIACLMVVLAACGPAEAPAEMTEQWLKR